ncbi:MULTISPECIES: CPBP family intramembrane glutamic endopeptidase [Methanobacterium]|jgi:membrane protease YdiL (CAAX protease family)|uniref:Abortive infection protein n=1 Tax=Methanobacterium formicicum TaxID=2162 RepID=A0A090I2I2_METFO|nr:MULTISPECIES: type II CAAX endopeptidase family protein [Methanobacterium]KUK75716.1 MAG: CAAX amino terminal protease family [Methanobacterium sp. 42_16]MBF4475538.1 CPBP family intramembrane metalloprotease [Methanobacterium formicicum]MDD4810572.1 type II CAAX endopeptidase family protein [Methanobacterium formicicum]MDG3548225.1 type II CAAX endopeptidase family protein [Methanobacterium formicicum]MDH2659889.1 type II CAAX endopeptidase family protein [Methanobacterium formicicum]
MSTLSPITFLDNASEGSNSWWKYVLTVIMSLVGGSLVAGIILGILLVVLSIFSSGGIANIYDFITSALSSPFSLVILVGISYTLSYLFFYICLRFIHHKHLLKVINTVSGVRWKLLFKGLILWALILFIFSLPDLIINPGSYQITYNSGNFLILLVICLLVFPLQASFEEILFRGYLMQGFSLISKKPWIPLLITSVLFGIVHFFNGTSLTSDLSIVASTFVVGMMLGVLALADNGIESAMGVHIANNLYVALFFNSTDSGLQGLPSVVTSQAAEPFSGLFFLILASILMIVILFWNRKEDVLRIFR